MIAYLKIASLKIRVLDALVCSARARHHHVIQNLLPDSAVRVEHAGKYPGK